MSKFIILKKKLDNFDIKLNVPGDKSISIRWVLFASIGDGVSKAKNLLMSEDVIAAINAVKKLGIKVKIKNNETKIYGKGINGYQYKKNLTIDAKNSGTLGRLLIGILVDTPYHIKLIGDESLSKRDFRRISDPLSRFGAKFKLNKKKKLTINYSRIFKNESYQIH